MWGGFQGSGVKTVLPREAHAKISCRLVAKQGTQRAHELLRGHFEREAKRIGGIAVELSEFPFEAGAFKMDKGSGANAAAAKVLEEVYGRKPVYFRMGGSIPVLTHLRDVLGVETTMFAFGHSDENVHAPDEYARIDSFRRGEKAYVRLFAELGGRGGTGRAERGGKEEL